MEKEQFQEWKSHPVTIEIFKEILKTKHVLETYLSHGLTLAKSAEETQSKTAKVVGNIEGLNQLLNISYQEEDDGE